MDVWLILMLYAIKRVHLIIENMHNKNEGPSTTDKKVISFKKDRRTLWLIEVLYAIKRDVLWFIG